MSDPQRVVALRRLRERVREVLRNPVSKESHLFDVFISYRRGESAVLAREIYDTLVRGRNPRTQKSLRVFWDDSTIRPGQNIHTTLEKAVRASSCFVVLLTETYSKTDYTRFEEMLITAADWGSLQERILPIMVQPCQVPERLRAIKYFDFGNIGTSRGADTATELQGAIVECGKSQEPGPEDALEWAHSKAPPLKGTASFSDVLLESEFRMSTGRTEDGRLLLFDSEFIYLASPDAATVRRITESSRILDATVSCCGRYVVASLGQTILRIDLDKNRRLEVRRNLDGDERWQSEHKETLNERNYWEYSPEMIYRNVAVSAAASILAGSRVHHIPDGQGGYSMSAGFESVDLFDLETGAFIEPINCLDPGVLSFSPNGKYLVFGQSGHGVSCYDIRRKKVVWRRWPNDNIDLEVIRFLTERLVLVGSRYSGFSAGYKVGVFNIANGNEEPGEIDHLEWSQTPRNPLRATSVDAIDGDVYVCFYEEKRGRSHVRRMSMRLKEIASTSTEGKVEELRMLSSEEGLAIIEMAENRHLARVDLRTVSA